MHVPSSSHLIPVRMPPARPVDGHCSRSLTRCLCVPLAVFWVMTYLALITFDTGPGSLPGAGLDAVPTLPPSPTETLDQLVDRAGICDRMSRGLLSTTQLNSTIAESCRRWVDAQSNYFRLRPTRVNWFDRDRLMITGEKICTNRTEMIVIVHSLHSYRDRRDAIRESWGQAALTGDWPTRQGRQRLFSEEVRIVFLFGRLEDVSAEQKLRDESRQCGDVVQGDFGESYRNMTLKSLTGLAWVIKYCPSVRFLFKCDDDMFVNIPGILDVVRAENMTRAIMGPYNEGSRVYRKGKWALKPAEYPFYHYPPYESGSGYVISADLLRPLVNASDYVPYIFIDDVYVTGILGRVVGARHVTRSGFAYWTNKAPTSCAILNGSVLTGTRVNPERQKTIWSDLVKGVDCSLVTT